MRSAIIGFVVGVAVIVVALIAAQQVLIREVAPDLNYRFSTYVFDDADFPPGDFEQGRLVHRCLFPVRVERTFYDSQYNEVTKAEKPGRYGALITIRFIGGTVEHRYITLYRAAKEIFWWDDPWSATAQLPDGTGIDPAILQNQAGQIGEMFKHGFGDPQTSPGLAVLLAGLSETTPRDPPSVDRTGAVRRDSDWWFGLRQKLGLNVPYPHLVDLPKDYAAEPDKKWPLILYLHSNSECGTDLGPVRHSGIAKVVAEGRQLPSIVVSPVCPRSGWSVPLLAQLLDDVCARYRVDPDRIYLAGISGGGDTVLDLALAYPDRFAALVFVAGESDASDMGRLKDIPAWAFSGAKDDIVPTWNVSNMVDAIRKGGGHAHLTVYPDLEHNAWDRAFAQDALYTWMLAQKRGQAEVVTPEVPTP